MASHVVGVDVGGTFTDVLLVARDGERSVLAKVPSTTNPAEGVVQAVLVAAERAGVSSGDIDLVLNGTTVVTNTVLEQRGARVGLLVTRGFRYILEIARSWTPGPVSGWMIWEKPPPLADTRDVRELGGRISAGSEELEPLDEQEVRAAVRELATRGVEAITIALMNGYLRPDVEEQAGAWAEDEAPSLPVSLASHVVPEIREYERTLAAVANAYVQPEMSNYVRSVQEDLSRSFPNAKLNIVRSDGGVMSGADAIERPVETIFSGPAGGVRAAVHVGQLIGRPDVLSFDIGGTSTDVALSRAGQAAVGRRSSLTDYYKLRVPSLDVVAIGACGGSIARVPVTGALRVGPDSAGSVPGPACYGRGGAEPTVTDANVVLGYLPSLLDDQMPIHRDLAQNAVQQVATGLDLSLEQAARAIVDVANDRMLGGLRLVSVQRGHDPREFTLVAFGGAGPLHANALMELIGTPVTVIPPSPGVFSTLGFLVADMQREFGRSRIAPLAGLAQDELISLVDDLERDAMAWLDGHSIPAEDRKLTFQFGIRYARQGYELPVMHEDPRGDADLAATLARLFEEAHERTYRFTLELAPELVVVRCVAAARQAAKPIRESPKASAPVEDAVTRPDHHVYWDGEWVSAPVYSRAGLGPGHELVGPVIVEQEDSTTFVHPGTRASVDRYLNLLLEAV
jgi:N-methylhydantoinase A